MTLPFSDAVRVELAIPTEARIGDVVQIVLRVTNAADRAIDLYLRGREIAFDVVATSDHGDVVWRLLDGAIVPAIVRIETLEPNASISLRAEWPLQTTAGVPVAAGVYMLTATLLTDGLALLTSPVALHVRDARST